MGRPRKAVPPAKRPYVRRKPLGSNPVTASAIQSAQIRTIAEETTKEILTNMEPTPAAEIDMPIPDVQTPPLAINITETVNMPTETITAHTEQIQHESGIVESAADELTRLGASFVFPETPPQIQSTADDAVNHALGGACPQCSTQMRVQGAMRRCPRCRHVIVGGYT